MQFPLIQDANRQSNDHFVSYISNGVDTIFSFTFRTKLLNGFHPDVTFASILIHLHCLVGFFCTPVVEIVNALRFDHCFIVETKLIFQNNSFWCFWMTLIWGESNERYDFLGWISISTLYSIIHWNVHAR